MKKVLIPVFLIGLLLPMLLFQSAGEATLIFDTDLSFEPQAGKRYHYWMFNILLGLETRWADRNFIGGAINCLYDDIIHASGSGVVNGEIEFSIYEPLDFSTTLEGEQPFGGPGARPPGFGAEPPIRLANGHLVRNDGGDSESGEGGSPLQGTAPGGPGGGGGDTYEPDESFYLTPIFENNIKYTISSSGQLLDVLGLETIGDIVDPTFAQAEGYFDPARSITVRQIFQIAHFLVLPDYTVHVGETWKAPLWWDVPFIGKPIKIPLTYKLEDIRTFYRFKCAVISCTGITDIEEDLVDENYTRRKESHVEGDIIINANIYFDIDRAIIVAMKYPGTFGGTMWNQFIDLNLGRFYSTQWGFIGVITFDRIDLITPLGNVLDPRTEKDHVLQDFIWRTDMVME